MKMAGICIFILAHLFCSMQGKCGLPTAAMPTVCRLLAWLWCFWCSADRENLETGVIIVKTLLAEFLSRCGDKQARMAGSHRNRETIIWKLVRICVR